MPIEIPNLWSELIRPGILSPLALLRSQAEALIKQTNGILVPEIDSEEYSIRIKHTFQIVVPALDAFRYSALEVAHHKDRPYPVFSLGPGLGRWREEFNTYVQRGLLAEGGFRANSQDEFVQILANVFRHPHLVGTLQGLIARVGDI